MFTKFSGGRLNGDRDRCGRLYAGTMFCDF